MNVGAAKARNVANQTQAEVIIEEPEAAAYDGLRCNGPGEADSWRDVVGLLKLGIVVPTKAPVHRQAASDFPIVLKPQAMVVVTEFNAVGLGCEPASGEKKKESGINRAKLFVVGLRSKELILLGVGFDAVHLGPF